MPLYNLAILLLLLTGVGVLIAVVVQIRRGQLADAVYQRDALQRLNALVSLIDGLLKLEVAREQAHRARVDLLTAVPGRDALRERLKARGIVPPVD